MDWIKAEGMKVQTTYYIGDKFKNDQEIMNKAMTIGMEELKKRGEL